MKLLLSILATVFSTLASHAADNPSPPKGQDPIVGHWRWAKFNYIVDIRADGSAESPGGKGFWKAVPSTTRERKYEIVWRGGAYVDALTLSQNGLKLTGKNHEGTKFTSARVD